MATGLLRLAERVDTGDHTTGVVSGLDMQTAAFPNLVQASNAQGIRADLLAPMQALMERGVAAGYGAANRSGLFSIRVGNRPTAETAGPLI